VRSPYSDAENSLSMTTQEVERMGQPFPRRRTVRNCCAAEGQPRLFMGFKKFTSAAGQASVADASLLSNFASERPSRHPAASPQLFSLNKPKCPHGPFWTHYGHAGVG
jgi:hypothetical protein